MKENLKPYVWADNMRVTATVGVVFLHIAATNLSAFGEVADRQWWIADIYNSAVRFCVPLFVMLTGALLIPKEYQIKDFLRKKLVRIALPFLFWSFVYITQKIVVLKIKGQGADFSTTLKGILLQLKDGSTSYHLWYVYMIIGIYLFIPIIGKWARNSTKKELLYFLTLWLISLLLAQPAIADYNPVFRLTYFSGFLGYLVLGYYLSIRTYTNRKRIRKVALGMIILSIAVTAAGTYVLSGENGRYESYFHGNFSPNVVALAIGVFVYIRNREESTKNSFALRNFISRYSFGIYLVHVLVLKYLDYVVRKLPTIPSFILIPVETVVCVAISGMIIMAINKIPYGKYISG